MTTTINQNTKATTELIKFFKAYDILRLEVSDTPGNGTEINAYDSDLLYIPLALDDDEVTEGGYTWDTYCQLVLSFLFETVGEYSECSASIQLYPDDRLGGSVDVTERIEF